MDTPTASLDRYTYKPLTGSRVRLLRLAAAEPGQPGIDCELIERDLIDRDLTGSTKIDEATKDKDAAHNGDASQQESQAEPDEEYEAVSWCWGTEKPSKLLRIKEGDLSYSFYVSESLECALKAFRYRNRTRLLWVDAICINQSNMRERNQQVPRMDQIYGQAKNVCIWIGEEDKTSHRAMEFIKKQVLKLWSFDVLCADRDMAQEWHAMSMLMKRRWFSRRWVVQEIALAKSGVLYCGKDSIPWQDFADAVSLFVEAESVPHKLSEVMRKDHNFDQIQNFYGHVPALGAALLVDATSNIFRSSRQGDHERRERLLSLEYLVSRYTVFEASQPRDTIYALLAIAQDTTPQALEHEFPEKYRVLPPEAKQLLSAWYGKILQSKVYTVDYRAPLIDVYKDFIQFAITQAEPKHALNMICRPWAPRLRKNEQTTMMNGNAESPVMGSEDDIASDREPSLSALPSWIRDLGAAAFVMQAHANEKAGERMDRQNADPLVGMPGDPRGYSAAGMRSVTMKELKWSTRGQYHIMSVEGFVLDSIRTREEASQAGNIPPEWLTLANWNDITNDPPAEFWRTLVADRGPDGHTTQSFYPRACKEAWTKAPPGPGVLVTDHIIENGRSTVIAEFLRRVQAVIWNRRLIRTANGHLGLVHKNAREGDSICILYGCSVPVVLRKHPKSNEILNSERREAHEARAQKERAAAKMVRKKIDELTQKQQEVTATPLESRSLKWNLLRFACICALTGLAERRHGLTLQGTVLLNSLLLVLLHPFENFRPNLDHQFMKLAYQITPFVCAVMLGMHAFAYVNHVFERILATVGCAILVHYILMSQEEYQYVVTGKWFHAWRKTNTKKKSSEPVAERAPLPEPAKYYWELIGECYVDGMMDGEAISYQNRENLRKMDDEVATEQHRQKIRPRIFELV